MKRQRVASSQIKSIGYEARVLEIEFVSGAVYQYRDVPPETHHKLVGADSIGVEFHKSIRPKFKGVLVGPDKLACGHPSDKAVKHVDGSLHCLRCEPASRADVRRTASIRRTTGVAPKRPQG